MIGAPVPGTPSIRALPSYVDPTARRLDDGFHDLARVAVEDANGRGPDRERRPGRARSRTVPRPTACCRSWARYRRSLCRRRPARTGSRCRCRDVSSGPTITALLVRLSPPPMPSICRTCGEPMTASKPGRAISGIREDRREEIGTLGRAASHQRQGCRSACGQVPAAGGHARHTRATKGTFTHDAPTIMPCSANGGREHPIDHDAGLAEVVRRVAQPRERGAVEMAADLRMRGEELEQRRVRADRLAAEVVDEVVRVLAADVAARGPSSPPPTSRGRW